jgi:hypothetical protein
MPPSTQKISVSITLTIADKTGHIRIICVCVCVCKRLTIWALDIQCLPRSYHKSLVIFLIDCICVIYKISAGTKPLLQIRQEFNSSRLYLSVSQITPPNDRNKIPLKQIV